MMRMKILVSLFLSFFSLIGFAQGGSSIHIKIIDSTKQPLSNTTVALKLKRDSSLVNVQITDSTGEASFTNLSPGDYFLHATRLGFASYWSSHFYIPADFNLELPFISLQPSYSTLSNVTVSSHKQATEIKPGKTIIYVEAGISTAGTTAMETLEKIPGITIDKDGNIALKGRSGVLVLIDGKQTYLDPSQLATLLNGMSAFQISTIEVMDQPSSKYDAAGNAGIINIRLKKNTQKGFNGTASVSFAQGVYPKNNDNLQLNYLSGRFNLFLNYTLNLSKNFTKIYALRKYYDVSNVLTSQLEQPSYFTGKGAAQNFRSGIDYNISQKSTAGIIVTGFLLKRNGSTNNPAAWLDGSSSLDSLIQTDSKTQTQLKNAGLNFNFRHAFTNSSELSFDIDRIGYRINGDQYFENKGIQPATYTEATSAELPSDIDILSAKADYTRQVRRWKVETGIKTSHIETDNIAVYKYLDGSAWKEDLGKSNHFLYTESIHALYGNAELKSSKWNVQGGLRYELTNYDAHQLGNALVKDSSFSKSYNSLFPSTVVSYNIDSSNTVSVTAGRRIDRPAFQKLNPFVFIINKYTYQTGNPFFSPQYTWNLSLSHSYKNVLITELNYSITHDYFSQIFPVTSNGIIIYTEGNLDRLQSFSGSVALQLSPAEWWSLTSQVVVIHKKMEGFIAKRYNETVTQGSFNFKNQLRFKKGWSGELSGFYNSKSRNDIQEVVDPSGQVAIGVAKTILQKKGTIKLAARDIFYTQWMKGNTQFTGATEYFKLTRDTRVVNLSFSYRFGKTFKTTNRSHGAAREEIERVGNG